MKASALEQLRRAEADAANDWHPLDGVPAPDYVPERWTPEHVQLRMIRAYETVHLIVSRPGPGSARGFWPGIKRDRAEIEDVEFGIGTAILRGEVDRRPTMVGSKSEATARLIAEMERALRWPALHVSNRHLRTVLMSWCNAKARKHNFQRVCREKGWAYSTARRKRDEAAALIASSLNRTGVAVY